VKRQFKTLLVASLASQAVPAMAQLAAQSQGPAQVVVTASAPDAPVQREFVAGKIIIERQRIEQSGSRTVEELLKREPSVTVSGDGRIGLLNLPGYTQLLIDGQAPAGGRTLELDLVHVEKVEIIKSSMAEYGPFGIAGTINIVSRKAARKTSTTVKLGARGGRSLGANVSVSYNQSTPGSALRYSANFSASDGVGPEYKQLRLTSTRPGQAARDQYQGVASGVDRSTFINGAGNVTWQRGPDETIKLSPDIGTLAGASRRDESRRWNDGTLLSIHEENNSPLFMAKLPLTWAFKPDKLSQVDIAAFIMRMRIDAQGARLDAPSTQTPTVRDTQRLMNGRSGMAELTYKTRLRGHDVKAGASSLHSRQDTDYRYRIDGRPDPTLDALGAHRNAVSILHKVFVQDEWRIGEHLALNAGASLAQAKFDAGDGAYRARARFRLFSPSLHVAQKVGEEHADQLRLSLARSFQPPDVDNYTVRPDIHPLAPCSAAGVCPANTIDSADSSGNSGLLPERALALNLAWEHALADDSQVTLELFTRRIANKIGDEIVLEDVAWSNTPRYVSRPANLGDAMASGLNLEMEVALRDFADTAPKLTLRGSAQLTRSRVASLPGPDNRLDKQTPWSAKLGGSYAMQGLPLKFDFGANWTPPIWARTSASERVAIPRRMELEATSIWTLNKDQRVVVNLKARLPHGASQINEYSTRTEQIRLYTMTRQYNQLGVTFETKL
jgi:outer membrane receptor for ferrienterochelin and colicins